MAAATKKFAVSRVAFRKREAERIMRRMKHFGVTHLRITGCRGTWLVRGCSTATKFAGFVADEARLDVAK